jgi:hypothetical protein
MDGAYRMTGAKRDAYRILVGKTEGNRHWEDQDIGG